MNEIAKPAIVAFEVTQRCPLRCRHCRAGANSNRRVCSFAAHAEKGNTAGWQPPKVDGLQDALSTDQCRHILDAITQLRKCIVVLTGGEPMMRRDIFELVEYGRSIGHRMAIATCGAGLDEPAVRQFKNAGLLSFSFSLDGPDAASHDDFRRVPGAFDTAIRAIRLARNAGVRFQINTTITTFNADKLDAIAQLAVELGAACWNPFMLVPVGRAAENEILVPSPEQYESILCKLAEMKAVFPIELRVTCGPQFVRVARQKNIPGAENIRGCLAGGEFAFIGHTGDVQTCGFLKISAGNLLQNGYNLADIWRHSPLLNAVRDVTAYKPGCGQCDFGMACRGCRARAYTHSGDVLGPDPLCIKIKN